ncbi:TetR/AcrR family transcriptional regulator [Anthocerotibacter panamensis]|uniref:TetR/AcrR family transcriptional regulator n=1 Tax=Anthocerotibacter panamensis TaxID=2857077 RepID=UPI001C407434|nr:TetR/AcrR family transcriptional regulator [Anthocerotibacter panamensis]
MHKAQPTKDGTRVALIRVGLRILREKGYNHTGLQEILQASGVPKGSFYHFFDSKEAFGLAIIDHDIQEHHLLLERYLKDPTLSPVQRLYRYFADKCTDFATLHCREGCLLGNLGQELADQNETFRVRIEQFFRDWQARLAQCLKEAQQAGEIPAHLDTEQLAGFWINSWEGALLQMKITKSPAPLHAFMDVMFGTLLQR